TQNRDRRSKVVTPTCTPAGTNPVPGGWIFVATFQCGNNDDGPSGVEEYSIATTTGGQFTWGTDDNGHLKSPRVPLKLDVFGSGTANPGNHWSVGGNTALNETATHVSTVNKIVIEGSIKDSRFEFLIDSFVVIA